MFLDANGKPRAHFDAIPGGLSVGIPGDIAMFEMAHKKYGKLPWAKLFAPAIRLSEKGFQISAKLAAELREFPQMAQMPDIKAYLYHKDGTPLNEGEIVKNRELAKTLRRIAKGGAKAFYSGPIAQAIVDKVHNAPVNRTTMTLADLASYRAWNASPSAAPIAFIKFARWARRVRAVSPSCKSSACWNAFHETQLKPDSLSEVHLSSEASRLAFADRAKYLGDPDVISVPVAGLIDRGYLAKRSKLIDPETRYGSGRSRHAAQQARRLRAATHAAIAGHQPFLHRR